MLSYLLDLPDPAVDAVLQLVEEAGVVQFLTKVGHLRLAALVGALLNHLMTHGEGAFVTRDIREHHCICAVTELLRDMRKDKLIHSR